MKFNTIAISLGSILIIACNAMEKPVQGNTSIPDCITYLKEVASCNCITTGRKKGFADIVELLKKFGGTPKP